MTTALRNLMLAVLLATLDPGPAFAGPKAPAGCYADQKVAYHTPGGPEGGLFQAVPRRPPISSARSATCATTSMRSGRRRVEIRVVSNGDGVALFQAVVDDEDLASRIDALKAAGVRFLVCANTLRERGIDRGPLHGVGEDDLVPSGRRRDGAPPGHGVRLHPSLKARGGDAHTVASRQSLAAISAWLARVSWSSALGPMGAEIAPERLQGVALDIDLPGRAEAEPP